MAVYSQQPTILLGILLSWCISTVVASQTNCRQVESCSLHCTASIFLALWVTCGQQGQTMEASGSDLFMTVMTVQLISTGKIEMKHNEALPVSEDVCIFPFKRLVCFLKGLHGKKHDRFARHVDAWLCILSSPPHCWASCCHGVYPQWWRPRQTAGKSSHAPCIALLPYS